MVALWFHSLSSLEEAVLSLLESLLASTRSTPLELQQRIAESLLVGHTHVSEKLEQHKVM